MLSAIRGISQVLHKKADQDEAFPIRRLFAFRTINKLGELRAKRNTTSVRSRNDLADQYVANDVTDKVLYRNIGDGNFMNISYQAKVANYRGSMGMVVGDWDGD